MRVKFNQISYYRKNRIGKINQGQSRERAKGKTGAKTSSNYYFVLIPTPDSSN